jgi:hypothetical protein
MNRVWEASRQSGGALLVLLAIADFADDEGLAYPSISTLARKARLSDRQVQRVIAELVAARELMVQPGCGRQGSHLFHVMVGVAPHDSPTPRQTVTPDNMSPRQYVTGDKLSPSARHRRRDGVTPASSTGVTPASPKPSFPEPSRTVTPLPPATGSAHRQQRGELVRQGATQPLPAPSASAAEQLIEALYRGLSVELDQLTPAMRARELVIAEQLVQVGATPAEAEAYARDMGNVGNRLAPIDLRSFERERASWLARRRAGSSAGGGRYVDRTGQDIDGRPVRPPPALRARNLDTPAATPLDRCPETEARARTGNRRANDQPSATFRSPAEWTAALRRRVEDTD